MSAQVQGSRAHTAPTAKYCRVRLDTNQSIPNAAYTPISWTSDNLGDSAGFWTPGSPTRLTVPEAGTYEVAAGLYYQANGNGAYRLARVNVNGTTYGDSWQTPGPYGFTVVVVAAISVSPANYFEVVAYQDAGAAVNIEGGYAAAFATIKKLD